MFRCLEGAPTIDPRVQGATPSPARGPGLGEPVLPFCAEELVSVWERPGHPGEQPVRSQRTPQRGFATSVQRVRCLGTSGTERSPCLEGSVLSAVLLAAGRPALRQGAPGPPNLAHHLLSRVPQVLQTWHTHLLSAASLQAVRIHIGDGEAVWDEDSHKQGQ